MSNHIHAVFLKHSKRNFFLAFMLYVCYNIVGMKKNLTVIGNSLGLIIEKPILDLLGITRESVLEMKTDGHRLIIEPLQETERTEHVRNLTRNVIKTHSRTFKKLAE